MEKKGSDAEINSDCVEPIKPSSTHTVLFEWPIVLDERFGGEVPAPKIGNPKWSHNFVRLPCAPESKIQLMDEDGTERLVSRWERIQEAFCKTISSSKQLEEAILSYNLKYKGRWKFHALHQLFEEELSEDESEAFFKDTLPRIIKLAFQLPELIPWAIPLLKQNENKSISLSQMQVGCLLANAFLSTFPRRNSYEGKHEYSNYPAINFSRLFQSNGANVLEKIKCLCNYFRRITGSNLPRGVITFSRRCFGTKEFPKWEDVTNLISESEFIVESQGTIEDATGTLQVDFANKYLGGGVLGHGCVQEEIRFVINPELLLSKLFCESLRPNEAILITGAERFSKYTGYASTFKWNGNYKDETPWDSSRRKHCTIVAIDALEFRQSSHQFREELMQRELNKAYVGFFYDLNGEPPPVGSGNWGCGAFRGEPLLKSMLQLMVCSTIKRPLYYFTFGNDDLKTELVKMYDFLRNNQITVCRLWKFLKDFSRHNITTSELYSFIYQSYYDEKEGKRKFIPKVIEKLSKLKQPSLKKFFDKNSDKSSVKEIEKNCIDQSELSSTIKNNVSLPLLERKIIVSDDEKSEESINEPISKIIRNIKPNEPKPGSSSGFSLMSALDADYDTYSNNLDFDASMNAEDESPPKRMCLN